jgi:hypothetical protein
MTGLSKISKTPSSSQSVKKTLAVSSRVGLGIARPLTPHVATLLQVPVKDSLQNIHLQCPNFQKRGLVSSLCITYLGAERRLSCPEGTVRLQDSYLVFPLWAPGLWSFHTYCY